MSKTLFTKIRIWLADLAIPTMMAGLLFSRTALSVGMIVFVSLMFLRMNIFKTLRKFYSDKYYWSIQLLLFVFLISFFWSENKLEWWNMMQLKAPFLFLPPAFLSYRSLFSKRKLDNFIAITIGLTFFGSVWSAIQYFDHAEFYNKEYLRAKIFPVPMGNEHIRFSQLCAIVVLMLLMLMQQKNATFRQLKRFLYPLLIIWFVVYIHLLASRSGMICLYIVLLVYAIYYLVTSAKKIMLLATGSFLVAIIVGAYFLFPTLKHRFAYIKWDFTQYREGNYHPGLNDAPRWISLQAGYDVFKEQPLAGVGAGDLKQELDKWFTVTHPQWYIYKELYPPCEWVMYAAATGIIGVIALTWAVFLPFIRAIKRKNVALITLQVVLIFSLLIEWNLTVQNGIFIYLYFPWLLSAMLQKKNYLY